MVTPHLKFEEEIWIKGGLACGVDEVGRGCIAGPVVAAAVVFSKNHKPIKNVRDSKKLTPKMRKEIFDEILNQSIDFGIGLVPALEIDRGGINPATKKAMMLAIESLTKIPEVVLIDAVKLEEVTIIQKSIIRGDENVYSISAASIIAKVFRDAIISGLDNVHPNYSFSSHKGYGTKKHYEEIEKNGLTEEHRKSFLSKRI